MHVSRRRALVAAIATLTIAGGLAAAASDAGATGTSTVYLTARRACATSVAAGHATCFAMRLVRSSVPTAGAVPETSVLPAAALPLGPSGGYTPTDIATAYGFKPTAFATGQVVGIVDAFDNPTIKADLATFDTQYGLAAETAQSFKVVNQNGTASPLPPGNTGWAGEEDLDVQTVRGLCNRCKIILVEATSNSMANLDVAENTAVRLGATVVSNSFGGPEGASIPAADLAAYNHPGVAIVASTGDDGWYGWDVLNDGKASVPAPDTPSSLSTVIAVGGTTLNLTSTATRASETVWNNNGPFDYYGNQLHASQGATGGGCSTLVAAPAWQSAIPGYASMGCGTNRLAADVAAVADPFTGYDIFLGSAGQWETFGGTSLSSPVIASMIALAGGGHGVTYPAQTIYSHYTTTPVSTTPYFDVHLGANGACSTATTGACLRYFGGNPNTIVGETIDCNFGPTGTAVLANTGQCNAGVGFDGPTGVGAPKNLNLFKP